MNQTFTLTSEYIQLNKLLKLLDIWESGGEIKGMISEWLIFVNGKQELRIRNKLVAWDIVTFPQWDITITLE